MKHPQRLWLGAFALAGLMSVQAHAKAPTDGYTLLRSGDRAAALAAFEAVEAPDARTWRMIGDLRFSQDDADGALKAWQAGFDLDDNPAMAQRLTHGAIEVGDFELAARAAQRLVDIWTERATSKAGEQALWRSLAVLSEVSTLAGDFTTGEQSARELIRLAPKASIGHIALAYVHLQAREYADAEDLYLDILAREPANTTALNNLGNVYYMQADLDTASEHFEAILAVDGATPYAESLALSNLAELLQLQREFKGAEQLYQDAIAARPQGAWGYMGLAALYDVTGRYDAAIDAMISGWERDDNKVTRLNMHFYQPEWYWQRDALIAEIEGEIDVAIGLWERVLKGDVELLHKAAAWHLHALADD